MPRLHVPLVERPEWRALEVPKGADMQALMGRIASPLRLPYRPGTLTVAMIVKNEAANIAEAIASFKPIADEIVVNDTGSTDGTQDLLESLGVKWFQGDWRDDFSYARNLAIDQATSSWVLWMDADDRIPSDQVENFLKLKSAPLDRGFGFQVINTQGGLPIGGRFMQVRMFPNHPGLRFRYRIHEQILHAMAALGLHLFYTETTLWHTGYEDPALKHRKARRNLDLLAREAGRMADEPALAMSVGDSHYILGEWRQGIEAYRKVWEMPNCQSRHRDVYAEIPCCIGRGHQHLGQMDEAIAWFEKSMALQPAKVEPFFYRAECLMQLGRRDAAEAGFDQVTRMPLAFTATANQYDVVRMYAFYHLARLQAERQDDAAAIATLERMHASYDQVVESWILLGQMQLRRAAFAEALEAFEHSLKIHALARIEAHLGRIQALVALRREHEAAKALREAKAAFPGFAVPLPAVGPETADGPASAAAGKARLSLCMIVKNEEAHLPACLDSVRGLADETVIVDTGSTDATPDIIARYGARRLDSPWRNDFSEARNVGLQAATGDWILWLDADDRLAPEALRAIRSLVEASPLPAATAYGFLVKNSGDGGKTGSVFNQIRLFPNRADLRFESPVHEQILPAIERAGLPVSYTSIQVLHTGYSDEAVARLKQQRNRAMLEAQVEKNKDVTPITLYTLANACADLGDFEAAETWYRCSREAALRLGNNPHVIAHVPVRVAVTLASRGRPAEAWEELKTALAAEGPVPAEALLLKAQVLDALGRIPEAVAAHEALLDLREGPTFVPVDVSLIKVKALQYLGRYWHARGERELAVRLLRMGLDIPKGRQPDSADLRACYREYAIDASAANPAAVLR